MIGFGKWRPLNDVTAGQEPLLFGLGIIIQDRCLRQNLKQLFEPLDFYIEESPNEDKFRRLAEMYVEISQDEMAPDARTV